ncbi:unnamed protein product [Caenorhabditis angaria]|uniref:Serpentine receptor class r-10 n=1 Tax=Caenorhabditis angaria TaxID=860376 RepID=A0A9P1N5D5_9PELO|nr:unnamed protein product [Caenorhabditis angaria]
MLWLHILQYIGFFGAQITNLTLCYLIVHRAEKLFGQYKYVMMVFALFDVIYSWIEVVTQPIMHTFGSMFIVFMDSPLKHHKVIGFYLTSLYCAAFACCISLLAAQFVYRYLVLCRPHHIEKLKGIKLVLLFIPAILMLIAWFLFVAVGMSDDFEKQEYIKLELYSVYSVNLTGIAFIGAKYRNEKVDGTYEWCLLDVFSAFGCSLIIFVCGLIIAICASKIYSKMNESREMFSEKTKSLNHQLFMTLVFQTLIPCFMMYAPVASLIMFPMFWINWGKMGNSAGALACLFPFIEPIIAIVLIKDFRKAVSFSSQNMLYLRLVQIFGFLGAQFSNIILLYLLLTRAKKLFGAYRYVMLVFTIYNLIYSWIEIATQPVMYVFGSMFIVYADSPFKYYKPYGFWLVCVYCASFGMCIALLATQISFRYMMMCRDNFLKYLNGKKLGFLFIPSCLMFIFWFLFVFFGMSDTIEKQEYIQEELFEVYEENSTHVSFIAAKYFKKDENGDRIYSFIDLMGSFGCSMIISSSFATIVYCAKGIYAKMNSSKELFSAKTVQLNRQLFITLVIQTILPCVLMYGPVGSLLLVPLFEVQWGKLANITGALLAIYPSIEPLIAIWVIKDFRNAVFRRKWNVTQTATSDRESTMR